MAPIQDLKLPVPKRPVYRIERSTSSPDVVITCSPVMSVKRKEVHNCSAGKRFKWSKQHVSWRVALPALGDHEILLEAERSLRGHRRVLINGFPQLDTINPLEKIAVSFKLAGTYKFDVIEHSDGRLQLLVDDVPFDELERCTSNQRTTEERPTLQGLQSRIFSIPGFGRLLSASSSNSASSASSS